MTPLPKKRHAKARSKVRRAAQKLALPTLVTCKNCGSLKQPHTLCPNCKTYENEKRPTA